MCKVDEKWFKNHGWNEYNYETVTPDHSRTITRKSTAYSLYGNTKYKWARWEHVVSITKDKWGDIVGKSNFYMFSAYGKRWHIENRISYRQFTVDQIESALKVVGLK